MNLKAIFAMTPDGVIGHNGGIPWKLSEDLQHFKVVTMGHTIVMGRKTWESLGSKPLPGRENIILSKTLGNQRGVYENLFDARLFGDVFLIGGAEIFNRYLLACDEVYVTVLNQKYEGDAKIDERILDMMKERMNVEVLNATEAAIYYKYSVK